MKSPKITIKCKCSVSSEHDVRSPDNWTPYSWDCPNCGLLLEYTNAHQQLRDDVFDERMRNQTPVERELQIRRVAAVLVPLAKQYNEMINEQLKLNGVN